MVGEMTSCKLILSSAHSHIFSDYISLQMKSDLLVITTNLLCDFPLQGTREKFCKFDGE